MAKRSKIVAICVTLTLLGSPSCTTSGPKTAIRADVAAGPPSNVENACAIRAERESWYRAARKASQKWNAPTATILAIIWRESSFRPAVRPPKEYALGVVPWGRISSAYGFSQALDGTWDWYLRETGARNAERTSFADAADFVGWYMDKTRRTVGLPMSDAKGHYIAYHEGHGGFKSMRWQSKPGVVRAANQVARRSAIYDSQLRGCDPGYATEMALKSTPLPGVRPIPASAKSIVRKRKPSRRDRDGL